MICTTCSSIISCSLSSFDISLLNQLILQLPSTRKQKAKERCSRQLDMVSDMENVEGSHSRNDERNNENENEVNLDSGSSRLQQNFKLVGEYFRSLLNSNSRESSETTIETTGMITRRNF